VTGTLGRRLVEYAGVVNMHGDGGGTDYVCDCWGLSADGQGDEPSETAEANARLISAAPALLAALRELVREANMNGGEVTPGAVEAAETAIAAACGE
jgi:hypothetical protein